MNYQKLIENAKLSDMKEILSGLRTYREMTKKLGARWAQLFHKTENNTHDYVVEYYSSLWEDNAFEQALTIYKKSFGKTPTRDEIRFVSDDRVKGGMKVYLDDSMVDVSFKKVENILQK